MSSTNLHPLAGKPVPEALLVDLNALQLAYFDRCPDPMVPAERVAFGTSGHRGSSARGSFNEAHILAITQAICDYRRSHGIDGPLYLGKDTHALSRPAEETALSVLAANGVSVRWQRGGGFTPTPVVSHAIVTHNRGRETGLADGIVVTPSHNPPADGGFKYNPPGGGPADTDVTDWIEARANALLVDGSPIRRATEEAARRAHTTEEWDFVLPYVADLGTALDLSAIAGARLPLGVDPLGGAAVGFWGPIAERYGLDLTVVNPEVDSTFRFLSVDHDGKVRMDCSSPFAMAGLVGLKDRFAVSWGNDPDADRHGIVTRSRGLLNPNHYLAVAISYLLRHRLGWPAGALVGKTLVSSMLIDRVVAEAGRDLAEVPVGFKWFSPGLLDGTICFGGEESAGASFLRRDGTAWTTDKDGLLLGLLAAEITAVSGRDPGELYDDLVAKFGAPAYTRIDTPATPQQKLRLKRLSPDKVRQDCLAGDPIVARLTQAPYGGAAISGLKVVSSSGWFAARPSGTEDIFKLYAESLRGEAHLAQIVAEAQAIIAEVLSGP